MSGYSPASHEAYRTIDLQAAEAEVLAAIRKHFAERKFTRAELADAMKWSINRITGRVLSLHEKGILDESETTVACPITGGNAHQVWLKQEDQYESGHIPQGNSGRNSAEKSSHNAAAQGMGAVDSDKNMGRAQVNPAALPDACNGKRADGKTGLDSLIVAPTEHAPRSPHCDGNLTDFPPGKMASHGARSVDTGSEEWRHECEVRHVANLPSDGARNKYLTAVHEKRGAVAWKRLRGDVWNLMRVAA